jgi:hydrogenase maturation protease
MPKTLIVGLGNLLLSDDGVGVRTVQRLQGDLPETDEIQVLDGGTSGLDLLYYLEGVSRLIVVDAVEQGKPAGTLIRLVDEQVPAYLSMKISPHQVSLPDLLVAARLINLYPEKIIVWGVQPASLEWGTELSPEVEEQVDTLVVKVKEELGI